MIKVLRVGEPFLPVRSSHPEQARRFWHRVIEKQTWFDANKEHLIVLLLSTRYDVQGYSLVSIGTLNETLAHPREIFRAAVASGCNAITVLHNHPSGDPWPSDTDQSFTRRLYEAGNILQIRLVDHVIVGLAGVASAAPNGSRHNRKSLRMRAPRATICSITPEITSRQGYYSFREAGFL